MRDKAPRFAPGSTLANKKKRAGLSQAAHEQVEDPALLVLRLESSDVGCQWLLEKWNELLALLEEGQSWKANERFMALRMLRLNTLDVMHAEAITSILQACQALEPGASGLVEEFWDELVAAKEGWSLERLRGWMRETPPPADEAAARLELIEIVQVEVATLEETLKELEENAAIELKYLRTGTPLISARRGCSHGDTKRRASGMSIGISAS